MLPPVDTPALLDAQKQLLRSAVKLWLNEEWIELDVHEQLGEAAATVRALLKRVHGWNLLSRDHFCATWRVKVLCSLMDC